MGGPIMPAIPEALAAALADRYRLERELGAGGMATVYLAEDLKHHRLVAIKVLRPDLAASLGAERFLREIAIAARLSHPHILGLHDSGEADGFLYYVMPYVEGISLRQKLVREGELPIPEAVRVLRDIADALAHAHHQGVVHRDIKPENVMLVERHALVMDFGVAKALAEGKEEGSSSLTSAGVALGTPAYMAPEQATGEGHVDHRADLYAWGVVAYELLAGQPPFVRATPQNTLAAQVTATPEPITHHRANVHGSLARLVMQCLEKKPADRPQTAEEVLRQLETVLTPSGGMTPADARPYQTAGSRRVRRRTLLIGALSVVGLAVIGLLGWRWWQGRGVSMVADLVLVAPLEAEGPEFTGLALDLAGLPTAIGREGVGTAVPAATVRDLAAGLSGSPMERAELLAEETGAGYLLRTSCTRKGAGAACQLELFERPRNRPRMAVLVTGTTIDSALSARLQEQALAMLLLELYWGDQTSWLGEYITPSLEAVRAFNRRSAEGEDAELLARAARADSMWITPLSEWIAGRQEFTLQQRDSTLEALSRRPGLTDRDRITIQERRPVFGDPERYFEIVQRLYPSWPSYWLLAFERAALQTGRPQAALEAASRADSLPALRRRLIWVNIERMRALHQLGRFEEQVALAKKLRTQDIPGFSATASTRENQVALFQDLEIQGRAGLGDVEGVRRVVAQLEGRTYNSGSFLTTDLVEDLDLSAALELMAHGHATEGEAMLAASLPALRELREQQGNLDRMEDEVWTLEWTGRLEEARHLAEELIRTESAVGHIPELIGSLGKIAARQGRRAEALGWSRQLADSSESARRSGEEHKLSRYLYNQAAIAARLGERAEALRLLQDARSAFPLWSPAAYWWVHKDPDFTSLRGYAPFDEYLKPKG